MSTSSADSNIHSIRGDGPHRSARAGQHAVLGSVGELTTDEIVWRDDVMAVLLVVLLASLYFTRSLHFAALATTSLPQSHREPSGGGMGRKFAATLGGERSVRGKPKTRYVSVSYEGLG